MNYKETRQRLQAKAKAGERERERESERRLLSLSSCCRFACVSFPSFSFTPLVTQLTADFLAVTLTPSVSDQG